MKPLRLIRSGLMVAALAFPAGLSAQTSTGGENEGAIALLNAATHLASDDSKSQLRAAYSVCLLFGHNGRVTAQTFEQDGWSITEHSEDEIFEVTPPNSDNLAVYIAMNESFCGVSSGSTGTDAALEEIAYLMTLSGEEVLPDVSDDGCPLLIMTIKDAEVTLAAEVFSDEEDAACESPANSHVTIMSIPND